MRRSIPAAAAAAVLLAAAAARADVTASSTFGWDGSCVPGAVTPVRVELSSSEKPPVRCLVEIAPARGVTGVAVDGVVHSAEVFLAPGAKKRLTLPVLPRSFGLREWNLTLRTDRRTLLRHGTQFVEGRSLTVRLGSVTSAAPPRDLEAGPPVVGVLGDPGNRCAWMGDASRHEDRKGRTPMRRFGGIPRLAPKEGAAAALPQFVGIGPESAPDLWICYEGMDAILWVDPDPDSLKDAAQLDAVLEYAACGGRLVVALTPGARLSAASPLARALPALATGHDDVPAEEVLAAVTGVPRPGGGKAPVPVARLGEPRGTVLARLPDGRPLAVRADHGIGTIVVLSFDPRLLSKTGPAAHAALLRAVFGPAVHADDKEEEQPYFTAGLEPLGNHLRKRFLTAPPLLLLVLGLGLYVAAIGPLDYFLLKKRNKLRRTVITFPLLLILFTLLAYGASFLLFGGTSGQARVAWIDFATAPGRDADVVRGIDVVGTYSPAGTTLEVAYEQPRSFLAAPWLGSGSAYGGRDGGSLDGRVAVGPDGRPAGAFDLPLRYHRTVEARFSGGVPLALDASVKRTSAGRMLEVRNGLKVRVRDAVAVVDSESSGPRSYSLGDVAPGGTVQANLDGPRSAAVGTSSLFPEPFQQAGGLFNQSWGPWGSGSDQFAPVDGTEEADEEARTRMAHAAMGASLAGLSPGGEGGGRARILGRHGLDVSRLVLDGRVLVMGWCDEDPLGNLPAWRNVRSTAAVVRRLLPAEEAR